MSGGAEDLADPEATAALAERFARALPVGGVLLIDGPMGAGKTTFVAALARAWGSDAAVTSPTYVLAHEYPSPVGVIVHIDLHRLPAGSDLEAVIDVDLSLIHARAIVVEWAERLATAPANAAHLTLTRIGERRRAQWSGIAP